MKQLQIWRVRIVQTPFLGDWFTLIAGVVYAAQSIVYIFTSRSMLDEGLYLVKGWYFATGQYTPFQDYGVLTNHMPLAFLIPGYILKWFGASLLTGRVYAVILGLIAFVALCALARRLGGQWWAAFVAWALALNVAQVRIDSLALSQVLIAALVGLMLWISLRRRLTLPWAAAAGVLAAAVVLVRINMLPLAGLWLLYIWLQHGSKSFVAGLMGFAAIFLLIHALYWPNILRLWAYWIPQGLVPALEPFYTPWDKYTGIQITPNWAWLTNLDDTTWNPIISFWQGVRFNFVVLVGVLANLLLWPRRRSWPDAFTFRASVFLNVAFVVLLLVHMWAALGGQSCTEFCFSGYVAFFSGIGLLAIMVTAPYWRRDLPWAHQVGIVAVLVVLGAGIGFGAADQIGKFLAELPVPSLSGGVVQLWGYFENKFGVSYRDARKVIPALAGFGAGISFLLLGWLAGRWKPAKVFSLAGRALLAFLAIGFILAPTPLLSLGDMTLQCGGNLIATYDQVGAQLSALMRPGERLYYRGPNSPAILLYLPAVQIYPAQLNNVFSFSTEQGTDSDALLRFGYWNQQLKEQWMHEADVVLIEDRQYAEWAPLVDAGEYDTVFVSEPLESCRGKDSSVVLLRRVVD